MLDIYLKRFAYTPHGVFGQISIPETDFNYYTVERPWADNQPYISCIPHGTYPLKLRTSSVVRRSSGGAFTQGYEVVGVPNRSYIMLHPANEMDDLKGCIGMGDALGFVNQRWAVLNSRATFAKFMAITAQADQWMLHITPIPQNIGVIAAA